jgi:hypothetical protein
LLDVISFGANEALDLGAGRVFIPSMVFGVVLSTLALINANRTNT